MSRQERLVPCPCGRQITKSRMSVHAIACEDARDAGYAPPPVKRGPCKCGCGEEAVSVGVKSALFVDNAHRHRWRSRQDGNAERHAEIVAAARRAKGQRSLVEAREAHEREAMVPVEQDEAGLRALYEHSNATFFNSPTYWSAERIRLEALSWRKVDEASGAVA